MSTDNKIAKAVGALFIITMILGMIDAYIVAPILNTSLADYSYSKWNRRKKGKLRKTSMANDFIQKII